MFSREILIKFVVLHVKGTGNGRNVVNIDNYNTRGPKGRRRYSNNIIVESSLSLLYTHTHKTLVYTPSDLLEIAWNYKIYTFLYHADYTCYNNNTLLSLRIRNAL